MSVLYLVVVLGRLVEPSRLTELLHLLEDLRTLPRHLPAAHRPRHGESLPHVTTPDKWGLETQLLVARATLDAAGQGH